MEILGDVGLIHEIAHDIDGGEPLQSREWLAELTRRIERAIPGYAY